MGLFRKREPSLRAEAKLLGLAPTPAERTVTRILFDEMPKLEDRARASAAAAQAGDNAGAAAALGFKLKQ